MPLIQPSAGCAFSIEKGAQAFGGSAIQDQCVDPLLLSCTNRCLGKNECAWKRENRCVYSGVWKPRPDRRSQDASLTGAQKDVPFRAQSFQVNPISVGPSVDLEMQHLKVLGEPPPEAALSRAGRTEEKKDR